MQETKSIQTIGVMGSGQLGRMFTQSAHRHGYKVSCYSPASATPCGQVGAKEYIGEYTNLEKLSSFLEEIDVLTFEFENIPEVALQHIEKTSQEIGLLVCPSAEAIRIAQNRSKEKSFLQKYSLPTTHFYSIQNDTDYRAIREGLQFPYILKINEFGYDGKGQKKISSLQELDAYIVENSTSSIFLEEIVDYQKELSVILARFSDGSTSSYPVSENIHRNHILDTSIHPAVISKQVEETCQSYAYRLAEKLQYVGVLGVEFFLKPNGEVLLNEFAPRPHNSGHFSMNGFAISQFDLQVRAVCNLPQPQLNFTGKSIMKNLLGEDMPQLQKQKQQYLESKHYHLHLYGKEEARKGRKMGHWNYTGPLGHQEAFS
ncbi:MAG: 5-(carboxyamino)imidazole ribonucleotide synthase [Spirochaetota bacterium]